MQRADKARCLIGRIKTVGIFQGVGIECDDRVDGRTLLVIGRDPIQIGLGQLTGGERARTISRVNVADRRFHDLKRRGLIAWPLRCAQRRGTGQDKYAEQTAKNTSFPSFHSAHLPENIMPRLHASRPIDKAAHLCG